MKIFFSDLDNTLIYSYKHDIGKEKQCVETYQGREVSFMAGSSYHLLRQVVKRVLFVPVTTRTMEQYARVDLGIGTPEYALVCNGGVLLRDGARDLAWEEGSGRLVADCQEELCLAAKILDRDPKVDFEIRNIEGLFLFTKSQDPRRTAQNLKDALDGSKMDVFTNGVKVYAMPKVLTKGAAVRRFCNMMKESGKLPGTQSFPAVIAAGDSAFDIPMLLEADLGLAPSGLEEEIGIAENRPGGSGRLPYSSGQAGIAWDLALPKGKRICCLGQERLFSEEALRLVERLLDREQELFHTNNKNG